MAFSNGRSDFLPRFIAVVRSPLFLALAALGLVLITVETNRPHYFLYDDSASWFIGAYLHDYRVLTETGRVAEVNYYQHGGEPFLQQGQTAVLYPPIYLGVALAKIFPGDVIWTIDWIAALHLTLGLVGFYFWLRQGGVTKSLAALGALAWAFSPFVCLMGASWIMTIIVAAWLPWLFWAFDRLLVLPSTRSAIFLGTCAGLLFLQGYVQWFAYAIFFLGLYALFQFIMRPETRRPAVYYFLLVSLLIFAALALPLLLPMIHAVGDSATRKGPLSMENALYASVDSGDIFPAQFCDFDDWVAFGATNAILYSPGLLFLPVMAFRLYHAGAEVRRRLVPLVALGLLAVCLSTEMHSMLSILPLFDRFRWPFKVFLFADFFLVGSVVWAAASWTQSRLSRVTAVVCLTTVVLANLSVSVAFHENNILSGTILPSPTSPLPHSMDPHLGRVVAFSNNVPDARTYYYFASAYATYFAFPSLGGYNPLVGQHQLEYSLYLDYPNVCAGTITPDFQKVIEAHSVRYWIVDPKSSQFQDAKALPGLKPLDTLADRIIFEDTRAQPLVFSVDRPTIPRPFTYSGNSLLIPLAGITSPISVSLAPTDGWWYRIDRGPWQRASYNMGLLTMPPQSSGQLMEVTYFDPRFHRGLFCSIILLVLAIAMIGLAPKTFPCTRANRA